MTPSPPWGSGRSLEPPRESDRFGFPYCSAKDLDSALHELLYNGDLNAKLPGARATDPED